MQNINASYRNYMSYVFFHATKLMNVHADSK